MSVWSWENDLHLKFSFAEWNNYYCSHKVIEKISEVCIIHNCDQSILILINSSISLNWIPLTDQHTLSSHLIRSWEDLVTDRNISPLRVISLCILSVSSSARLCWKNRPSKNMKYHKPQLSFVDIHLFCIYLPFKVAEPLHQHQYQKATRYVWELVGKHTKVCCWPELTLAFYVDKVFWG